MISLKPNRKGKCEIYEADIDRQFIWDLGFKSLLFQSLTEMVHNADIVEIIPNMDKWTFQYQHGFNL